MEASSSAKKAKVDRRADIASTSATTASIAKDATSPRAGSKQALVIDMLSTRGGTTLDALVEATGWLPHTTRAALTGLRKRGFSVMRERRDGKLSVYRIASDAAAAGA